MLVRRSISHFDGNTVVLDIYILLTPKEKKLEFYHSSKVFRQT